MAIAITTNFVVQPLKHEHAVLVGSKRLQDGLKLFQRAGRILPEMGREAGGVKICIKKKKKKKKKYFFFFFLFIFIYNF
jgi:hypothetical protein